jgi:exopolyphosphatase/guanosine-5'-triphosphate,3'-diphosphate pyrophosphatase
VRFTEAFLHTDPPTAVEVAQTRNAARIVFADAPGAGGLPMRVVGGTARALALVAMGRGRDAEGFRITSSELARQTRLYAAQSVSQRRDTPGLDPDRADIILAGAIILETCMSRAGMTEAECTLRGLRHGVVLDMARGL